MSDPYRAPPPGGSDEPATLLLHVAPVHPAVRPGSELLTHAVVTIRAPKAPATRARPVLSGVLVLDVSGSMHGEPLAQVLHSAKRLAEILDDTDRLGIVTFSDGASTVAPLTVLRDGKREIVAKLGKIEANGRTNIAGGLAQAALLFPPRAANERQIVVLMSDGEPNVGAVTAGELSEAGKLLKARDVAISTLGFGAKHNDEVLSAIASQPPNPGLHAPTPHAPAPHAAPPFGGAAHASPHAPHAAVVPSAASQPLSGLPSQSANPAAQVGTQSPLAHSVAPCAFSHPWPHAPQFAASSSVLVSQPS